MSSWRYDCVDLAHFQYENRPPPDWDTLIAGSPGNAAVTKLTQRNNYLDPTAATSMANMRRLAVRRRGRYHWLSPVTEASITSQAAHFLSKIDRWDIGDFWELDVEQTGVTEAGAWQWINIVMGELGRPGAVYGGVSTAGGLVWRSQRIRDLGSCMWLAAYGFTPETLQARLVSLGIANLPVHVNQYSSDGPAPGISGRVDLNQINDFAVLDRCCGYTQGAEMIGTNSQTYQGQAPHVWKFAIPAEWTFKRPMTADYGNLQLRGLIGPAFGQPGSVEVELDNATLDAIPNYPPAITVTVPQFPTKLDSIPGVLHT